MLLSEVSLKTILQKKVLPIFFFSYFELLTGFFSNSLFWIFLSFHVYQCSINYWDRNTGFGKKKVIREGKEEG